MVRLPSEAEWEKAARGGAEVPRELEPRAVGEGGVSNQDLDSDLQTNDRPARAFPWGEDFEADLANTGETGLNRTSAVGCFAASASPYGCEEMAGNVWEWTRSLWGDDFSEPDFKYPYEAGDGREDASAPDEIRRVLRGGGFLYEARFVRCSARLRNFPYYRSRYIGFRLLVSPFSSDL